ncbi:M43 family zinc metalloprotease [Phaeodactylibacter luteus]|uniref:T9SS type A sorting domain-containing protein n=1 Tax=Phaeodactylibacter luteus TaxID=1564516 RepID=A0A5C6RMQ7_9BACT|nr:M43 family zinc metalloprotease [Phaeodactylibacter luteus]TXB63477.1 T9SS type A sorting domain-containing protein [Phaeodactylibacter luteus]
MKKVMSNTLLLAVFLLSVFTAQAQRNCGSMDYLHQQEELHPERIQRLQSIEQHTARVLQSPTRAVSGTITIPVVVHVVYNGSAENISAAQVQSQIDVLNEDFRRLNGDASSTPAIFQGVASDVEIEFCLAATDPAGNPTDGITRTPTSVTAFGTNDQVKSSSSGGKDAWPAGDYLNIWVCDISGGILGYAQFPGGPAATDGVVVDYQYFGTIGTATPPFNLGRTGTHEVGHYLNLRHIWGDGNCNADDFVSDTPRAGNPNYTGSPCNFPGPNSCNEGTGDQPDMFQNYMDYSDDACMNLFTEGQKARMRALFEPGGARASLLNATACGTPVTPTCNDGIQNGDETGVDCGGSSCAPCPCNDADLALTITFDNYPEETTWAVTDGSGTTVASGGPYGSQPDGSTVTENITLATGNFTFTISDAYGDGICCAYGNGAYTLTDGNGAVIAAGGSFSSSESTSFCAEAAGPQPTCNDGIQNGNETGVDCGGPDCAPCATCNDGIQNGNETGVDCGGPDCAPCATCNDGIQNGNETGVDCGGPDCAPCATCNDGIQNGNETGVDCGGPDCAPCSTDCDNGNALTLTIVLDNYPGETTWTVTTTGGSTVASGGSYSGAGSTVTASINLPEGDYSFNIFDSYGDGICCAYGNGAYALTDELGNTLASGGAFGSSESTAFCTGAGGGTPPTCNDGIQNGDETGVDCGGSNCAPCGGGGCTYIVLDSESFESGFGIWNDGGSDCYRSSSYANTGSVSLALRDNSSSSVLTTDNLNLSPYDEITVDFSYLARSMDNSNEDFFLEISGNGGASYTILEEWNQGDEFQNDVRSSGNVVISGPFSSNTRLRFRCDASGNSDWVYLDDIVISGCQNGTREAGTLVVEGEGKPEPGNSVFRGPSFEAPSVIADINLFPNPTSGDFTLAFTLPAEGQVNLMVTAVDGRVALQQQWAAKAGTQVQEFDGSQLVPGVYFLHLMANQERITRKFVVVR